MKASEYMASHSLFTTFDIQSVSSSKESAETALRRALSSGKISRIRRGLYASKIGAFRNRALNPFDVIVAADPKAVLSYRSALSAHGLAHNVSFDLVFRSSKIKSGFEFEGVRYTPLNVDGDIEVQKLRYGTDSFFTATTREQTFIDCLKRPRLAGGPEEVVRALSAITYLDLNAMKRLLSQASSAVRARAGWLLEANREKWHIPNAFLKDLESSLNGGVVRFGSKKDNAQSWSKRWNLMLPFDASEVEEWTG